MISKLGEDDKSFGDRRRNFSMVFQNCQFFAYDDEFFLVYHCGLKSVFALVFKKGIPNLVWASSDL